MRACTGEEACEAPPQGSHAELHGLQPKQQPPRPARGLTAWRLHSLASPPFPARRLPISPTLPGLPLPRVSCSLPRLALCALPQDPVRVCGAQHALPGLEAEAAARPAASAAVCGSFRHCSSAAKGAGGAAAALGAGGTALAAAEAFVAAAAAAIAASGLPDPPAVRCSFVHSSPASIQLGSIANSCG